MNLVTIISTNIDSYKKRIVKFFRLGNTAAETAYESMPAGTDANPIKGMVAIYAQTKNNGDDIIIGYVNRNQLAAPGEIRHYSVDNNGNVKFYTWIKNDGTIEIGGNNDYAVGFNNLKIEFEKLKTNFNNHLIEYNSHVHLGVTSGTAVSGITTASTNTNSSNIDNAKKAQIKTI